MSSATTRWGAWRAKKAQVSWQGAREARARPRPRDLLGHHAAGRARHAAHLAAQNAPHPQQVEMAPAAHRAVVDRAHRPPAASAPRPPALAPGQLDHHGLADGLLDDLEAHHPHALQPQQALEQTGQAHPVLLARVSVARSEATRGLGLRLAPEISG
jgi:hypothetical protein